MSPVEPPGRDQIEVGFVKLLGLRIEEASGDRVVLRCPVTADLHQPYGLVHGGVYATLAETSASVGGALWFADRGKVVGISNHTDFLRAVRGGELRAEATPLARGRTTQLWQVQIGDDQGRLVAHAKVRLQNVAEAPRAGAGPAAGPPGG
jgi:1,4-dihydroxy-2-naphthoyl-CoA hydrolase